jgi:hypothetical protein
MILHLNNELPTTFPKDVAVALDFMHHVNIYVRRKKPLGRPRRRWVDNSKIDLREIGWNAVDWINLA